MPMPKKSSKSVGPMLPGMGTCETVGRTTSRPLTSSAGGFPVKTYRLPDAARAWLESNQDFGLSSIEFLRSVGQDGLSLRTSLAYYPLGRDGILPSSFKGWRNSGMALSGGSWTLNISAWPSDAVVCSLLDILEMDVPQKYFLSARAARGILRRAEKRGRALPDLLRTALQQIITTKANKPTCP